MKNQYFGDVNDYRKYGLLRLLAIGGADRGVLDAHPGRQLDGRWEDETAIPAEQERRLVA